MKLAKILHDSAIAYTKEHPLSEAERAQAQRVPEAMAILDRKYTDWAARPEPALAGFSPAQYLTERAAPADWRQLLIDWAELEQGGSLPKPLREAVRARLPELGPMLVELIDQEEMWNDTAPGKGYAPILVAHLVGALRYAPSVRPLLKVIEQIGEFTILGDVAVRALTEIGEPAREGLYELAEHYKANVQGEPYSRAVGVLSRLPQDERTWSYLKRGLQEARELIGIYIVMAGDYGDQRAVYHLNRLLEERADLDAYDRRECLESIEMLGGIPTVRAKALFAADEMLQQSPFGSKVGRNDPCPCGSGKKYKKCCST